MPWRQVSEKKSELRTVTECVFVHFTQRNAIVEMPNTSQFKKMCSEEKFAKGNARLLYRLKLSNAACIRLSLH